MAGLHKDKNGPLFEMTLTLPQTLNLAAVPAWLHLLNQDASTKATKTFRGQTEFIEKNHISNAKMKKKTVTLQKGKQSVLYLAFCSMTHPSPRQKELFQREPP